MRPGVSVDGPPPIYQDVPSPNPPVVVVPNPNPTSQEKSKQSNSMRLQLQTGTTNLWSESNAAPADPGVTVADIRKSLLKMHTDVRNGGTAYPEKKGEKELNSAIVSMSQKVGGFPTAGVVQGGNVARVPFKHVVKTFESNSKIIEAII